MWPFTSAPKDGIPTYAVENTIGSGTRVCGDIRGPGGVRVDGAVEGAVEVDGPVVIGEGGVVEGGIRGRDVIVLGRVRGDVHAGGHLEIGPKGKIAGDVTMESFRMHKGGVFRGTSRMPGDGDLALPEASASTLRGARGRTLPPPAGAVPPPAPSLLTPPAAESGVVSQERILTPEDFEAEDRATG
ncbi:MAG: polymer-forming cytoskeletal protein [Deltaproteobacteria bacterium]|nr:polymer-forming cytoskeletal protein [Deltaproteobacteria bacterium]